MCMDTQVAHTAERGQRDREDPQQQKMTAFQ